MSIRRASRSIERMQSRTSGTSSSEPSARSTSSTSTTAARSCAARSRPRRRRRRPRSRRGRAPRTRPPRASSSVARDGQLEAAQRHGVLARRRALQAQDRLLGGAGAADDPPRRAATTTTPSPAGAPARVDHVEGAVEPVRPADAADPQGSLDDVDEDAAVVLDRGGLDDRPEGLGGASAASDDLSVVIIVHRELEHERAVVLLELLDLHLSGWSTSSRARYSSSSRTER